MLEFSLSCIILSHLHNEKNLTWLFFLFHLCGVDAQILTEQISFSGRWGRQRRNIANSEWRFLRMAMLNQLELAQNQDYTRTSRVSPFFSYFLTRNWQLSFSAISIWQNVMTLGESFTFFFSKLQKMSRSRREKFEM